MIRWVIIFLAISSGAFCQQRIEGRVVDSETGSPIPFASIGIVGTAKGTSSNLNGEFSLNASKLDSIKISCLGYESVVIQSKEELLIRLKPMATRLDEVYIINKEINPRRIVRKAFASIAHNYDDKSFMQKFFYRHYRKSDSTYINLIEAAVDVWRHQGYRSFRNSKGEREAICITQLRRSLDLTSMVQAQTPISIDYILQNDIVAYQTAVPNNHIKLFEGKSNLKADFENYTFTFDGITNYDGKEVYKIGYAYKKDSVLTASGYMDSPSSNGWLFITTDSYAFVKTEDIKYDNTNIIRTSAYYRKYGDKYYPYHFIREGENHFFDQSVQSFHIELMSVEVRHESNEQLTGCGMGREELLNIPYDSSFWNTSTILKTTPLEDDIISDLGGGLSLNKQFYLYQQYERNVTDGGKNGEKKFNWLKEDSKGKRMLYVCFWNSNFQSYLIDLEAIKRLYPIYKNKITFVLVSLEEDETLWRQLVNRFNYFSDGIINYRIGKSSELIKSLNVKNTPTFILISKNGDLIDSTKRPSDPLLEEDFKLLMEQSQEQ